ncbi:MAG: 30S ribosomal protein S17 [bacterium]|nr:30S ribosomal protein S17 [bacterium]
MKTKEETIKKAIHRQFEGEVLSVAENKTIHVRVQTRKMHPKYKKQYSTSKKYAVHDEKNIAKVGDVVSFLECRPLSKTKRWRLIKVIK